MDTKVQRQTHFQRHYVDGTAGRSWLLPGVSYSVHLLSTGKRVSQAHSRGKAQACKLRAIERNTVLTYLIGPQIIFEMRSSINKYNRKSKAYTHKKIKFYTKYIMNITI